MTKIKSLVCNALRPYLFETLSESTKIKIHDTITQVLEENSMKLETITSSIDEDTNAISIDFGVDGRTFNVKILPYFMNVGDDND